MSQSNKKILVSGCGLTWSQQAVRTWVNVLQVLAVDVADVAGPAISNQTIINRAFEHLLKNDSITDVVIQLTSMGKLDVEIDDVRRQHLVDSDPIRNFVHQNIWPSSASLHHESKQLWYKWLYSPGLERQDLCYKLLMLHNWCSQHHKTLTVVQGYNINWSDDQKDLLRNVIADIDSNIYNRYQQSACYTWHNHNDHNTVPGIEFQIELAEYVLQHLGIDQAEKIQQLKKFYLSKHQ